MHEAVNIARKIRQAGKRVVLAGGCFDILHTGHMAFLEAAKQDGDVLFVLLESDQMITKTKGQNRPINAQKDRATILASLAPVDYVVLLTYLQSHQDYDMLVLALKPAIIATTKGDPGRHHKERQAKLLHIKVVDVMKRIPSSSTSKLAKLLSLDL